MGANYLKMAGVLKNSSPLSALKRKRPRGGSPRGHRTRDFYVCSNPRWVSA